MKKESFSFFTGYTNCFEAGITVREVKSTCADDAGEDRFVCCEDFALLNLGVMSEYSFVFGSVITPCASILSVVSFFA